MAADGGGLLLAASADDPIFLLADLAELETLDRLREELRDRFGRLPERAVNVLKLKELRLLAEWGGVEWVRVRGGAAV